MRNALLMLATCFIGTAFAQPAGSAESPWLAAATAANAGPEAAFELVSFTAEPVKGEGVNLRWNTGGEPAGSRFAVERSADGYSWQQVFAQPGEGDGSGYRSYEVMDFSPVVGRAYYRLSCFHQDVPLEVSDEFAVEYQAGPAIWFTADGASGNFRVQGEGDLREVKLLNNRGQFIPMDLHYDGNAVVVDARELAPGTYFVQALVDGSPVLRPLTVVPGGVIGG